MHAPPQTPPNGRVLFLAPNFLCHRLHKKMRGVEVFDIMLVRQMVEMGCDLTLAAEGSWKGRFEEHLAGVMPRMVWTPALRIRKPFVGATVAAAACAGRRFDVVLIGNTARGLLPAISILHRARAAPRFVVFANREPQRAFVEGIARRPVDVVAVSEHVAQGFRSRIDGQVWTYYGLPNAGEFHPGERQASAPPDGVVNFCMLGMLDSADKGAAGVVEAFGRLPADVRTRCRLHLASYREPPRDLPEGVIAYEWMAAETIGGFLRGMDVLVINSRWESFSQAMVQGMLTGLPVISCPYPTLVEKLDTGGGIVFHTADELSGAMERLSRDAAEMRRMGAIARGTALARYVWDTRVFVERYLLRSRPDAGPAPAGAVGAERA